MEAKIQKLIAEQGIDDQRTDAWHTKRGEMLTASEIWKCFGDSTPMARHEIIMSKLTPRKIQEGPGVGALIWGTRFEPIAKELYCQFEGGIQIVDTTCVPHPVHSFIGASPDGIVVCDTNDPRYGRLVEFKCPISRPFDDSTPIPEHYFHQMQLQMECTDLNECDQVEFQFKTMNQSEWVQSTAEHKSFFVVSQLGEVKYSEIGDPRNPTEWRRDILGPDPDVWQEWQTVYWVLLKWRHKLVPRDPDWMPSHFPEMKGVWDDVLQHREAGTLPASPKDKGTFVI